MGYRSPLITVMINAAYKAAKSLIRDFGEVENLQVSKKGPSDFVTIADHRAEKTLVTELSKARPKYGFLLEETGIIQGEDTSNRWVIDPLDGTTNFLHGLPHFAISIALERDGKPFAGVIYAPVMDELFWAENGQGAFLNNERLRISSRRNIEDCLIATGMPYKGKDINPEYLQMLDRVWSTTSGIRRFGAAALDLAYVAAGRYDGFFEFALSRWDIAAGVIIVKEAGGKVTDIHGGSKVLDTGDILASNGHIHIKLNDILEKNLIQLPN
ncbi:inositol monophosphatase [Candidatus Poribacteria bacterium]|nr:inositol monophosphatase [Candidatus Poribacteria bacterium]|tara:strand:+ start:1327 stop:2136 length:810 start_codon:yes stop_codon:yes gene_type:complete